MSVHPVVVSAMRADTHARLRAEGWTFDMRSAEWTSPDGSVSGRCRYDPSNGTVAVGSLTLSVPVRVGDLPAVTLTLF